MSTFVSQKQKKDFVPEITKLNNHDHYMCKVMIIIALIVQPWQAQNCILLIFTHADSLIYE